MKTKQIIFDLNYQLGIIVDVCYNIDLDLLTENIKISENLTKQYEAIGILDGNPKYYNSLKLQSICIERSKLILKLSELVQKDKEFIINNIELIKEFKNDLFNSNDFQ